MTLNINELKPDQVETLNNCPYCGHKGFTELFIENGFPHNECSSCGLIYLAKRVKREHLHLIYGDTSYHQVDSSDYQLLVGKKRLALFGDLPEGARIHEDGAGSGFFVRAAQEGGYNVTGSDLGQDAVTKAKKHFDISLVHGSIKELNIPPKTLDAFAAFNLFSHLYEPWDYIKEVSSLLKPGGKFLTRMGNRDQKFKNFRQGKFGAPEHVFHFNVNIINQYYKDSGLTIINSTPAFDSDYPYFLFDYSRSGTGLTHRLSRKLCSLSVKAWNALKLPKEDIYLLAVKD